MKRVRIKILYLCGLHNFANAQLVNYYPKTEITFLQEL